MKFDFRGVPDIEKLHELTDNADDCMLSLLVSGAENAGVVCPSIHYCDWAPEFLYFMSRTFTVATEFVVV